MPKHRSHPRSPNFPLPPPLPGANVELQPQRFGHAKAQLKSSNGIICRTSRTLDLALRAIRSFWQEFPTPYHHSWTSLLTSYSSQTSPFPKSSPPNYDAFYHAVITSPDSAPGADGIPFSAYCISLCFDASPYLRKLGGPHTAEAARN